MCRVRLSPQRFLSHVAGVIPLLLCSSLVGCTAVKRDSAHAYSTLPPNQLEEFEEARRITAKGLRAFEKNQLDQAEKHFRQALEANTNYGPAHNNLGQVYLARHQFYLAAWEFELASNLMPERVEPIIAQGLVYELAGRLERAEAFYRLAHEMEPINPDAIGSLARIVVKTAGDPDEIRFLLGEVVFYDHRPAWIGWAEELLATQFHGTSSAELRDLASPNRQPAQTSSDGNQELAPKARIEELPTPPKLLEPLPQITVPESRTNPSETRLKAPNVPLERPSSPVSIDEIIRIQQTH